MELSPGTRVGPYQIGAPLGSGGMGEVYRARDTKLGREVAIKVLPQALVGDADRLARFQREAQLLASLNHPNIAIVHGLEETAGSCALVMELVEGPTLAERMAHGPIPLDEALPVARQIAEALEAAHEHGIVHRDLKPANVKVRDDGTVKVLDFGLAKALDPGATSSADAMNSPTLTARLTQLGVILGTAAYMAPEQARGRAVDRRADIWAFGVVLYEMLTGRPGFGGETLSDTIAQVLTRDLDFSGLPAALPPRVTALLKRCLERDPKRRLRDIGEARIVLEQPGVETAGPTEAAVAVAPRGAWLPWAIAAAGTAAALLFAALWLTRDRGPRPLLAQLEMALPESAELYTGLGGATMAFSPDGSMLAFVTSESGVRRVHLRRLDTFETRVLPAGALPLGVLFSADGSQVGVIGTDRAIRQVSVRDGAVTERVRNVGYPGAALLPDGRVVFVRDEALWLAPVGEVEPKPLTTLDTARDERSHRWPAALPGVDAVLFTVQTGVEREEHIEAVDLATGKRTALEIRGTMPTYVAPGYLLFGRDDGLLAVLFDAQGSRVTGTPIKVLEKLSQSGMGIPVAAASERGHLAYLPAGSVMRSLVWVTPIGEETPLPLRPDSYINPRIAPDGRRIAVTASGGIWIADPDRETLTRLTASGDFAVWSPDGDTIYYRNDAGMYRVPSDGSGAPQPFPVEAANEYPSATSPDGRFLASVRIASGTGADIYVRPTDGSGTSQLVLGSPAYEGAPAFSPDGAWLVYASDESGRMEVFLRPFPGPDRRWQVSNDGGTHPRWNPSGNLLYYRQGKRMLAVDVAFRAGVPELSRPRALFEEDYLFSGNLTIPNYDVARDGSRLLMTKSQRGISHLSVMLNWPELVHGR